MSAVHSTFILRVAVAIILFTHSVPGMFNGGVHAFGKLYLDAIGFAPFGLAIAWMVKLSHVVCAILLLINKYVKPAAIITIAVFIAGIVMVHFKEGWFVVGGGRNGVEYNFLLICVLLTIMFQDGLQKKNQA